MSTAQEIIVKVSIDSKEFERDLARITKKIGRAAGVPDWCYFPWMRGLVEVAALAAPVLVLLEVLQ